MITEWILGLVETFTTWWSGLFGEFEVPDWLSGFFMQLGEIVAGAAGLGAWVPWPLILTVAGATSLLWGAGFLVKAVRWVVGWIPTMGGS